MADKNAPSLDNAYALETPEDNLKLYAGWAETYDSDFAVDHGYELPTHVCAAYLCAKGAGNVLDVGAGTGLVGEALSQSGLSDIDATDISPEMLEIAAKKGVYRALFTGDLTDRLPCEDASYDGIISAGTFTNGHVGPEAFDELLRITKPGGLIVLTINAEHFEARGFAAKFAALSGQITDLALPKTRIYATDADGPHKDDLAHIASFRRAR